MSPVPCSSRGLCLPVVSLCLALAACAPEKPAVVLRVAVDNVPAEIDPRYGLDQAAGRVADLLLDGLLRLDPEGNLQPGLAERFEVSDDATRYTFHLRRDVRFHDNRKLTAADVAWTFNSILEPEGGSPKGWSLGPLKEVRTLGEHKVEFILSKPDGVLPVNLTTALGIVPQGVGRVEFNREPVGTGPFRLVKQEPALLTFERFDGYWGGAPELDGLELHEVRSAPLRAQLLQQDRVDLVVSDLEPGAVMAFKEQPERFRVVEGPGSKHLYLAFNLEDEDLRKPDVRRAIALAIDRHELAVTVWHAMVEVSDCILPRGHWARHQGLEPIPYDHQRARELLEEAGYRDEPRLRLTYKTSDDATYLAQAEELRSMLAAVGIELQIDSSSFETFKQEIDAGDFQLFGLTLLGIVDPDIYRFILHSKSVPPEGLNRGRYSSREFDEAVELGALSGDKEVRRGHYLRAQERLARDLPWFSLFTKKNIAVMSRKVEGYVSYRGGEFLGLIPIRLVEPEERDDA